MPTVFIPALARELTGGAEQVVVEGKNVRQVINNLDQRFPGIRDRLCDGNDLKPGMTVAVSGHVSSLGLFQKLQEDSEIHFLPALGGGN